MDFEIVKKEPKMACCRSYLTPRGRCYTCVEDENT